MHEIYPWLKISFTKSVYYVKCIVTLKRVLLAVRLGDYFLKSIFSILGISVRAVSVFSNQVLSFKIADEKTEFF